MPTSAPAASNTVGPVVLTPGGAPIADEDWWVPPDAPDLIYARYGFPEAQHVLEIGNPLTEARLDRPRLRGVCGWHGTSTDPERGSFCIVKTSTEFAALVGERVKITTRSVRTPRSVVAYVHEEGDILDDLSVTRRLFMALALLSDDTVNVAVEVIP
jgi:hypothetical protein